MNFLHFVIHCTGTNCNSSTAPPLCSVHFHRFPPLKSFSFWKIRKLLVRRLVDPEIRGKEFCRRNSSLNISMDILSRPGWRRACLRTGVLGGGISDPLPLGSEGASFASRRHASPIECGCGPPPVPGGRDVAIGCPHPVDWLLNREQVLFFALRTDYGRSEWGFNDCQQLCPVRSGKQFVKCQCVRERCMCVWALFSVG